MKRFLGVLAALLLVTVLVSVVLAFTTLRPRTEVLPPRFEEGYKSGNVPVRSRTEVARRWSLVPPWKWSFVQYGVVVCGGYGQTHKRYRNYGPFAFTEKSVRSIWPVAVEKAARAIAVQKLGVKEPTLDIQRDSKSHSWHIVASAPGGKRLEMNLADGGKSRIVRR